MSVATEFEVFQAAVKPSKCGEAPGDSARGWRVGITRDGKRLAVGLHGL